MLSTLHQPRFVGRRILLLCLFCAVFGSRGHAASSVDSARNLMEMFNVKEPFAKMGEDLEYFRLAFTAVGFGAVMIAAIKRVARARNGDESMGWIASTVMTVALMATAPDMGKRLFEACDALADKSGYAKKATLTSCWTSLLVILPNDSPLVETMDDVRVTHPASPKSEPPKKEDGAWTKMAWSWMKEAMVSMTTALSSITGAFRSVTNRIIIIGLMFLPAMALLLGILLIEFGSMAREILHQGMDIFLPMMIAFASFAPMRGPATNFITKYISLALWPVAWALGNALAVSILTSVMDWVVRVSIKTLESLAGDPAPLGPLNAGLLASAAVAMPWALLIVIVLTILFCSLLLVVSAFSAPRALDALLTKGVSFVGSQLNQASQAARSLASNSSPGPSISAPQMSSMSSTSTRIISGAASRAGSSMSLASGKLSGAAAAGGPVGIAAAATAAILAKAGQTMSAMGGRALGESSGPNAGSGGGKGGSISMRDTGSSEATSSQPSAQARPAASAAPVNARNYRRTDFGSN